MRFRSNTYLSYEVPRCNTYPPSVFFSRFVRTSPLRHLVGQPRSSPPLLSGWVYAGAWVRRCPLARGAWGSAAFPDGPAGLATGGLGWWGFDMVAPATRPPSYSGGTPCPAAPLAVVPDAGSCAGASAPPATAGRARAEARRGVTANGPTLGGSGCARGAFAMTRTAPCAEP